MLHRILGKVAKIIFSVLDDETFVVMDEEQIFDIPDMGSHCGKLSLVGDPVTWKKSGRMFGYWVG